MVIVDENNLNERMNNFFINDEWKDNKELRKYLSSFYNFGRPIITKKKLEDIWYVFKEDSCNRPMNDTLYFLLKKLCNLK